MKKALLLISCLALGSTYAQQTITSVANGNANSPFTWDCTCFPGTNDNIIINHDVIMNVDWLVNGGGSITVSASGTFVEDANYRSILFDGAGSSFTNNGTTDMTNLAFTNGASGTNFATVSLDSGLWVGSGSSYINHASTIDVDSILNDGDMVNNGTMGDGDLWNNGVFNNAGALTVDSLLNTGTFSSTAGAISCLDFSSTLSFSLTGTSYMLVSNDCSNTGTLTIGSGRDLRIGNDMFNGSFSNDARIANDGLIEIGNDFTNTDSLEGSGVYCIANNSTNSGDVLGTLDICDNTGVGYFDLNTGNIAVTVTDCVTGCSVGISENDMTDLNVYPNPTEALITIDAAVKLVSVFNVNGQEVLSSSNNVIDLGNLNAGIYVLRVSTIDGTIKTQRIVKH